MLRTVLKMELINMEKVYIGTHKNKKVIMNTSLVFKNRVSKSQSQKRAWKRQVAVMRSTQIMMLYLLRILRKLRSQPFFDNNAMTITKHGCG